MSAFNRIARGHASVPTQINIVLLIVACAGRVAGQSEQTSAPPPPLSGIAHVAMRVANLDASRAFYKRLGFEEAFAFDQGGSPTEVFFKISDQQFIELYPQRGPELAVGFLHVCYLARDVQALNQAYRERGLSPTAVARGGAGNLLFSLSAPGLENIEFTQYMPGSRHSNDVGKHLGAHRISQRMVGVAFPSGNPESAVSFYARGLLFPPIREHGHSFHLPGDPADEIEVLSGDRPLRVTMEADDLKQTARELRNRGIPASRRNGALVIHDPDGNEVELRQEQAGEPVPR